MTTLIDRAEALSKAQKRKPQSAVFYLRVTDDMHAWIAETAARRGMSVNALVATILSIARTDEVAGAVPASVRENVPDLKTVIAMAGNSGAGAERSAIVGWLRDAPILGNGTERHRLLAIAYADAIERGDHHGG